jgi:heme/copper-type cytochrome/quinol oxidase subunit 2
MFVWTILEEDVIMDWTIIMLILGGLVVLGLLVVVVAVARGKRREKETDYRVFFTLGIIWLPLGIVWLLIEALRPLGIVFLGLGVSYLAIGLANRDKWAKSSKET